MNVTIENLSKRYDGTHWALKDINLTIDSGMFGLLGPNGAGKTTLMRILATLVRPTSGTARVGGYLVDDPYEKWQVKGILGYLPQHLALYGHLTAYEFLEFVAAIKEVEPVSTRREQIGHMLDVTGLTEVANRPLKSYSGGMRRRVGIAQALLGDPTFIVVDEPTVGLDPQERVRFRNLLVSLAENRLILLSTHIVEDIAHTCSELAILHQGELLYSGTVQALCKRAVGRVWEVENERYLPTAETIQASAVRTERGWQRRIILETSPHPAAQAVTPSLEDAYLWLMHEAGHNVDHLVGRLA